MHDEILIFVMVVSGQPVRAKKNLFKFQARAFRALNVLLEITERNRELSGIRTDFLLLGAPDGEDGLFTETGNQVRWMVGITTHEMEYSHFRRRSLIKVQSTSLQLH